MFVQGEHGSGDCPDGRGFTSSTLLSRSCGYPVTMTSIHVGLVADPASPTEMARRMGDLDPPVGEGAWDVEIVNQPFTTGCEDVDTALARLRDHAHERRWDVVVGLTELPLRDDDGRYPPG